jgi:asparagine synthase (glutamine-hydrolysing)
MKAILADPAFSREIDEEALAAYFTFSYIPAPLTIFRGIRKLLPAHTLSVDDRGIREQQYWDLTFAPNYCRSEDELAEEFRARMAESVRMRLISEVPLGAFLSGGVDSSAVVAFMAEASEAPVNTFTIGFTGNTGSFDDERKYARLVAERYRTRHFEHEVTPDVASVIETLVRSFDEPFADDSMMPSYFVCKAAREKATVALSGLGGDEAFCGYERYAGFQLGQWFTKLPGSVRSGVIGPLVNRLPESSSGSPAVNRLKRFVRSAVDDDGRRYLGLVSKTAPAYRTRLFSANARGVARSMDAVEARFLAHFRGAKAEEPLDRVFYCDVKTYLPDDILALTDRLSMCHSLEVRVPFLDHPLFEFAATIPSSVKMRWLKKKYLLKKALRDVLPGPVLTHKKQGFVGPTSHWLRTDLKAYTLDVLSPANLAKHGQFDEQTVRRILADHFEGRETNDVLIWALLVFQVWFQLYIERRGVVDTPPIVESRNRHAPASMLARS